LAPPRSGYAQLRHPASRFACLLRYGRPNEWRSAPAEDNALGAVAYDASGNNQQAIENLKETARLGHGKAKDILANQEQIEANILKFT